MFCRAVSASRSSVSRSSGINAAVVVAAAATATNPLVQQRSMLSFSSTKTTSMIIANTADGNDGRPVRLGGCACGCIRYELCGDPMIVHACHCKDCQRLTGSAFVINAWTESTNLRILSHDGKTKKVVLKGGSGGPHTVCFCAECSTAIYSHYQTERSVFVRVGTLDEPSTLQPDVHIWTRSKLGWLDLKSFVCEDGEKKVPRIFEEYYNIKDVWRPESILRLKALRPVTPESQKGEKMT